MYIRLHQGRVNSEFTPVKNLSITLPPQSNVRSAGQQNLPPNTVQPAWRRGPWCYLLAAVAVFIMTGLIILTHADASMVNIPPLYLLSVQAVAVLLGSRAAVAASFIAFLAFDWFFVEPRYQFTVRDQFEFVALLVFLASAILVGQLTALFQSRAQESKRRELAATAMAKASWTVASELDCASALAKVLEQMKYVESAKRAAVLVTNQEQFEVASQFSQIPETGPPAYSPEAVKFVFATGKRIDWAGSSHWHKALGTSNETIYLPAATEGQVLGILFVELQPGKQWAELDKQLVNSLANHIAVVLQRDKLMTQQASAQALAEADRLKTALLQMVSHDFRSPLASIKASVSSLLVDVETPVDIPTQHGLLEAIEEETDRLNCMVGNILDLSRLEAGAWRPQREPVLVGELVGNALDQFGAADNERIVVSLSPELTEVCVDSAQIVQVIKNLLENALKYSAKDTKVELTAARVDGKLQIEILDRGRGLPLGEEKMMFEPFYRAVPHRESSVPGMGMGLAVCRGLVEAHGGNLSAYNRDGGGSVFRATLPLDASRQ